MQYKGSKVHVEGQRHYNAQMKVKVMLVMLKTTV